MNPGEPSRTAIVVAKSQSLVGLSPATAAHVPPNSLEFIETSLQLTGHGRFANLLRHRWFRRLARLYERLMIPGLALHHTLRKQAVERIVRRELTNSATQVLQIGAGFDSLTFRLHREFPDAHFIELDHPDTQDNKRRIIKALGGPGDNLALQPIDLANLDANITIPASRRTVVIIEGVLMYFGPDAVRRLLRHIQKQLVPGSLLLFTFMETPGFRRQSPFVNWWLRASGEPFRWSLPASDINPFLEDVGFDRCRLHSTRDHTAGCHQPIAIGELLCEARPIFRENSTDKSRRGRPLPVAASAS